MQHLEANFEQAKDTIKQQKDLLDKETEYIAQMERDMKASTDEIDSLQIVNQQVNQDLQAQLKAASVCVKSPRATAARTPVKTPTAMNIKENQFEKHDRKRCSA